MNRSIQKAIIECSDCKFEILRNRDDADGVEDDIRVYGIRSVLGTLKLQIDATGFFFWKRRKWLFEVPKGTSWTWDEGLSRAELSSTASPTKISYFWKEDGLTGKIRVSGKSSPPDQLRPLLLLSWYLVSGVIDDVQFNPAEESIGLVRKTRRMLR
jgi:hypothetical protein